MTLFGDIAMGASCLCRTRSVLCRWPAAAHEAWHWNLPQFHLFSTSKSSSSALKSSTERSDKKFRIWRRKKPQSPVCNSVCWARCVTYFPDLFPVQPAELLLLCRLCYCRCQQILGGGSSILAASTGVPGWEWRQGWALFPITARGLLLWHCCVKELGD